jgi:hypothetical protein
MEQSVFGWTGVGQLRCPRLVLGAIAARACASPHSDDVPRRTPGGSR